MFMKSVQSSVHSFVSVGNSSKDSSNNSLADIPLEPPVHAQPPSGPYHRRRRASMQDALDHTKINASLYQFDRPVCLGGVGWGVDSSKDRISMNICGREHLI